MLPSVTTKEGTEEGIPNALKEAMAKGLPVIATNHGGNSELVDHEKSGYLVPEKDIDAIVEHLEYLVNHPGDWDAMGRNGRKKVEDEFEMEKENDRLEQLLLNLVG